MQIVTRQFSWNVKLFSLEIICIKYQILFSRKMEIENFKMSSAENFTQSAKR